MNYCSHCGSPDIRKATPTGDDRPRWVCSACGGIFYDNPRIIVGCLVEHEGKVLLCRRAIAPQYGLWNLPAGFLENGESAEEGARRETMEESKAEVEILKLHAVYSLPKVNQVYLHFLARMTGETFGPTHESLEVSLFAPNEVPWDQIAFDSTTFALERFFECGAGYAGVHLGSHSDCGAW